MAVLGKVVGGLAGFAMLGVPGAILGLVLGHQFDKGLAERMAGGQIGFGGFDSHLVREVFFAATFSVMGHLAKADGRVTENEIRAARSLMHQMQLSPEQVKSAIALFNRGKDSSFALDETLREFRRACQNRRDLIQAFVDIQLQAVLADGAIHASERSLLWRICEQIGISRVELAQIEAMVRAQRAFGQAPRPQQTDTLAEAYKALGIEASASDAEVKKAYRRLMNQHHPDKLVSRGLPESMMAVAEERTHEIRSAYEVIKNSRGIK